MVELGSHIYANSLTCSFLARLHEVHRAIVHSHLGRARLRVRPRHTFG